MSVFDTMIDTLFTSPILSQAATYTPAGGSPVTVQVVKSSPKQQEAVMFQTHASVTPYLYDVRVSEIAAPKDGDVLVVGAGTFKVRSHEKDEEQLVWQLNLEKQ